MLKLNVVVNKITSDWSVMWHLQNCTFYAMPRFALIEITLVYPQWTFFIFYFFIQRQPSK